jgi:hypothetical protein
MQITSVEDKPCSTDIFSYVIFLARDWLGKRLKNVIIKINRVVYFFLMINFLLFFTNQVEINPFSSMQGQIEF